MQIQEKIAGPFLSGDCDARQRILATARAHFFTHGFRGVTMDDLAHELGMSKKTLYAHFPSKNALIEALLLQKVQTLQADVAAAIEGATDFVNGLHELLACIQRHTEEVKAPFLRDIQREVPDLFKVVQDRRQEVIERYFGQLLGGGRKEGLIRKDIPLPLLIEILLGAINSIMNPSKLAELGLTARSGFTAIIAVVLEGVLTPEGRAKL